METKSSHPAGLLRGKSSSPLVEAYFELLQLKKLFRQGWLQRDVEKEQCETVAEHSFATALLAMFLLDGHTADLDFSRVIRMTLLHDLGEIYVGDLTPQHGIAHGEKRARERKAIDKVLAKLPSGDEYVELWHEYEAGKTAEARFVKEIDRIEMGLQAAAYEMGGHPGARELFDSAVRDVSSPDLVKILEELRRHMS